MSVDKGVIKVGDKVHYIPNHDSSIFENGVVKDMAVNVLGYVRVVYHCDNKWDKFHDYTGALTSVDNLFAGWRDD